MTLKPFEAGLAYYCSKYVAKGADLRWSVPWLERVRAADPDAAGSSHVMVPAKRAHYRTWTRSRGFGKSMRQIREELSARYREAEEPKATLDLYTDSYASSPDFQSITDTLNSAFGTDSLSWHTADP
jgi:hypothetical protein